MSDAVWSRRPYIGTLPKVFRSTLGADAAMAGLAALLTGPDTVGEIQGNTAWLRPRAWPRPPAATLRLTVIEDEAGAKVSLRFDPSRWDTIDLWVYSTVAAIGFVVAGSWLSGHMPFMTREKISAAAPVAMAGLAVVALGHGAFRNWRKAVRDRLSDRVLIAMGVPIE